MIRALIALSFVCVLFGAEAAPPQLIFGREVSSGLTDEWSRARVVAAEIAELDAITIPPIPSDADIYPLEATDRRLWSLYRSLRTLKNMREGAHGGNGWTKAPMRGQFNDPINNITAVADLYKQIAGKDWPYAHLTKP